MGLTWTASGSHWGMNTRPAPRVPVPCPEMLRRCRHWPVGDLESAPDVSVSRASPTYCASGSPLNATTSNWVTTQSRVLIAVLKKTARYLVPILSHTDLFLKVHQLVLPPHDFRSLNLWHESIPSSLLLSSFSSLPRLHLSLLSFYRYFVSIVLSYCLSIFACLCFCSL